MRKGDQQLATPYIEYTDTKANIEAMTGIGEGAIAYASDTNQLGTYSGSAWTWGQGTLAVVNVTTEALILAATPTSGLVAYGTDTQFFYVADGTNWRRLSLKLNTKSTNPDMGYDTTNNADGYYSTEITDKTINNFVIGGNGNTSTGGIRVNNGTFQIYLNGAWANVVTNFVMREDSTYGYSFEHAPIGFTQHIEIMTGATLGNLGLNNYPLTNAYKSNMGAYGTPTIIGGRSLA